MKGYYYCSLNTFFNILKNKQIYLSDPLKMNDNSEIKWYLERLNSENNCNNHNRKTIYDMMKDRSGIDFTIEELIDILKYKGQNSVYISCFSKEPDVLSQWRSYADDGKGVALGFNLDKFCRFSNIFIREVIYTDDVVYTDQENDVECVSDTIYTVITEKKIKSEHEQLEVFLHELIPELVKYKNPAFSEEKEIRLIYCDELKFEEIINEYGLFQVEWKSKKLNHEFRVISNNNITEFVKLDFASETIEDIYIGPKCLLNENDVSKIVNRFLGSKVDIVKSKASYR